MRALAAITLTVLLLLLLVPDAGAHRMSVQGAQRAAQRFAMKRAMAFRRLEVPAVTVGSCTRHSAHVIDCGVRYRFGGADLTCWHTVRVRFSSATSTRTRVRSLPPLYCQAT